MCEAYSAAKADYLYRGDVLKSVPFVGLDMPVLLKADNQSIARPSFIAEENHARAFSGQGVVCAANYTRRMGVIVTRTCEGAKFGGKIKVFPALQVAPIRPYSDFGNSQAEIKSYIDGILKGFPPASPGEEPGECHRFMVLPPCAGHNMPDGGVICLREMQPINIDFLAAAEKLTRLSSKSVGMLSEKLRLFFEQSPQDYDADEAAEGPESRPIADWKRRRARSRAEGQEN